MRKRYVLTMTAANRVGILAAVTNALAEVGGDLVEIRQTVLRGFFTMIIAADFPEDREASLVLAHVGAACQRYGVEVSLKDPDTEAACEDRLDGAEEYILTLEGSDEPGVMRALSAQLARFGIDITEMHALRSEDIPVADGGGFRAALELAVPPTVEPDELHAELESLGARLGLAVTLTREHIPGHPDRARPLRVVLPAGKPR